MIDLNGATLYGGTGVPPDDASLGDLWNPAGSADVFRLTLNSHRCGTCDGHHMKRVWEKVEGGLESLSRPE